MTSSGALMDSEVTNLAQVKAFDTTDYATAAQGTLAASAVQPNDSAALKELDLNAIATDISDTAVDVFVYDTSKDSDGGAWRKRTQHTSWYNEAASATRGSRKEFPAVAVIVATSSGVTIYDADDPDMPMWMVFAKTDGIFGRSIAFSLGMKGCSMLNGTLIIGNNASSAEGLLKLNFISDNGFMYPISSYSEYGGAYTSDIASRASSYDYGTSGATVIISSPVNDVAMTVLPNAPIDYATGLPVPTIAVATDGGVSVIKDDGTVVDAPDASNLHSHFAYFTSDDEVLSGLYYQASPYNYSQAARYYIPSSDKTGWNSDATVRYDYNGSGNLYPYPHANSGWQLKALATSENRDYLGSTELLTFVDLNESDPQNNSLVAYTTSDYNTGWMNGDIKLATLSDTDDTNVTGAELVTNGTFASNTTGWTDYTSIYMTVSHNSGVARLTYASNFSGWYGIGQDITTVVGKTYVASYDVTESDSGNMQGSHFYLGDSTVLYGVSGTYEKSGTITVTFVATSTTTNIRTGHGGVGVGSGDYYTIDNFTVRLAEEDRSVNGNGVQVFGTVTKTDVATGADLVAYSGFSSANYLMQPYNADIAVATSQTQSFAIWLKKTGTAQQCIFSAGDTATTSKERALFINADGKAKFVDSGSSTEASAVNTSLDDGSWHCVVICVDLGDKQRIYVDGKLDHLGALTLATQTNGRVFVGKRQNDTLHASACSVALFRISNTCPSTEQVAKMYNDEKHLFQAGAQATLYGTSDAVTALAHDDTTDLLHVGTSAGRSTFQGLRRVENTTTAVGTTISASNGLVAED